MRVVIHGTFPGAGVGTTDTFFYRLYCYSRHNLPERYCYRAHILQKSMVVIRGTISGRDSYRIFWVVVIHGIICNFSGPLRGCCSAHILKRAIRLPGKDRLLFTAHFAGFFSFRVLLCSAQFPFCRILCAAFPAISLFNTAFLRHFIVVIHGTICKNPVFIVVIRGTFPGKNSSASPGCYLRHNSAVSRGRVVMYGTFQTTRKFSFSSCYRAHISLLQDFFRQSCNAAHNSKNSVLEGCYSQHFLKIPQKIRTAPFLFKKIFFCVVIRGTLLSAAQFGC